jgi:L-lysine 2,3-aminomutase
MLGGGRRIGGSPGGRMSDTEYPTRYQVVGLQNVADLPGWDGLDAEVREAVEVVGRVLPFRTNRYVTDHLIDWSRVPADPIFQLVFPQRAMLDPAAFAEVADLVRREAPADTLAAAVNWIRRGLNPHPAGQLTHNVPSLGEEPLQGIQHKYRETVLFFPAAGQTCHAYCTYCFRWAQFVGLEGLKFEAREPDDLVRYLSANRDITDVLITGGDPMVMRTRVLRRYVEPLLAPELEHVQNIRIGTKALAYWPQRFVSDEDADDCLRLFEEVVGAGRHLALMGHYSHPVELGPSIARTAVQRVRATGAQIRMQAPIIRHVNDEPEAWADLWRTGVRLGLIPYYMFVERDTGARGYFEVPLARCYDIFRMAYSRVSGLARSVRGPSMSAFPGKVRILGVVSLRSMMEGNVLTAIQDSLGPELGDPDTPRLVCDFIQARDPAWVKRPFFAEFDESASWFDDLRPAFGKTRFYFEGPGEHDMPHNLAELTELLLE